MEDRSLRMSSISYDLNWKLDACLYFKRMMTINYDKNLHLIYDENENSFVRFNFYHWMKKSFAYADKN